jgi:OmpA-like transmembrane domain
MLRPGLPPRTREPRAFPLGQAKSPPRRIYIFTAIVSTIAPLGLLGGNALADDLLGAYVGGAVGQSDLRASDLDFVGSPTSVPLSVSKSATGWKLFAGVRPVSLVGAEMAYTDFGHRTAGQGPPTGYGLAYNAELRSKAATAFGILYAPLPIPILDVYAKAGVARLQTSIDAAGAFGCWTPLQCAPTL